MEKMMDDPMGPELGWITVRLPEDEVQFVLANFGAFDPGDAQPGSSSGYVLWTDDMRTTYEDWSGKGIEFSEPPTEQMWGTQACSAIPTATAVSLCLGAASNRRITEAPTITQTAGLPRRPRRITPIP